MKVCVNEITSEGLDIEQELDPKSLGLATQQAHFPSALKVKAHLEREKDIVSVRVFMMTVENILCGRCLEQFDNIFENKADFVYKLNGEYFIDLSDNIKDTIMLEHPIKQLCKADCKGLCQECGANLNQGSCLCEK